MHPDHGSIALARAGVEYMATSYPTLPTARDPMWCPPDPGGKLLAFMIWIPTILIFSLAWQTGQRQVALVVASLGIIAHSLLNTRVAIYALVASIVLEHVFGTWSWLSISKIMGAWAFIVSVPKIMHAMEGHRKMDPLAKWILLFLLMGGLSLALSPLPIYALVYFVTMVLIYALPLLLNVNLFEWRQYKLLMIVLILASAFMAVQYIRGGGSTDMASWERYEGTSLVGDARSEVNEVARLMAMGIFSAIFLFFTTRKMFRKLLCVGMGVLLCVGVVMTQTRACYIAIPLATVIGIWLVRRVSMTSRLAVTITAVVLTLGIFALGSKVGFAGTAIEKRLASIFDPEDVGGRGIRFTLWRGYTQASLSRGFVIGYGLNSTKLDPMARQYGAIGAAHSDFFHILGDLGLFGLIIFLGIHANLVIRIYRIAPWRQQYVAWMMWLFLIIASLFETDFLKKCYGFGIAMILLMIRLSERDEVAYREACAQFEYDCALAESELAQAGDATANTV